MWTDTRNAFEQAAVWFAATSAEVTGDWDAPALGEWTVRDLVGHTSRALFVIETYLDSPAGPVDVASEVDYYR